MKSSGFVFSRTILASYLVFVSVNPTCSNSQALDRSYFNSDILKIPRWIIKCYSDPSIWNRYSRLPSSVDSLVAIIRKIELNIEVSNWSPGKLAANIVHRFRLDGIKYDRCVDTSTGALPFRLDLQTEFPKMALTRTLINGRAEDFPEDILTAEEECALHWMLSYSVNTTFRSDEIYWNDDYEDTGNGNWGVRPPYGYDGGSSWVHEGRSQFNDPPRDCESSNPVSRSPWEMGVIWNFAGPVSAGTMLAGLASGLEPTPVTWSTGVVHHSWLTTLAGDLGQTALLKRKGESWVGPDGYFNSTICPTEFYMRMMQGYNSLSHLTTAEINGGLDGLLLGTFADGWVRNSEWKLSQIIDAYYSLQGTRGSSSSETISACERYAGYVRHVDSLKLREQAHMFAHELKNILLVPINDDALKNGISQAKIALDQQITRLDTSLNDFGPCAEQRFRKGFRSRQNGGDVRLNLMERDVTSAGPSDVALILDTSIFSFEDKYYMKQLAGSIALELDIWSTISEDEDSGKDEVMQGGSQIEVSEGRSGRAIISSERFHNKAELACEMLKLDFPQTGDLDPTDALEAVAYRMSGRQAHRNRNEEAAAGKSLVIVLIMFGRMSNADQKKLHNKAFKLRRDFPDVRLLVATRWAPEKEFEKYVLYPDLDIFLLNQYDEELRAEADGREIAARIQQMAGQIQYMNCDSKKDSESKHQLLIYVTPDTQRFLEIHPRFLPTSKKKDKRTLTLTLIVENNGLEVCHSRAPPEERALGQFSDVFDNALFGTKEECKRVNGSPSGKKRLTLEWDLPCKGKSLTRCRPIYVRLEGIDDGGNDCLNEDYYPCRTARDAKVTLTHDGMICNSASSRALSLFLSVVCLISCDVLLLK